MVPGTQILALCRTPEEASRPTLEKGVVWLCLGTVYVVLTVELTIAWNGAENVNAISTAGQIIPLITGAACLARVVYVMVWPEYTAARQWAGFNELLMGIFYSTSVQGTNRH